jgi:hypothetical protein
MMEGQQRGWGQQLLFWVSLALLLLVSVWWRVKSLHNFAFGYDEGRDLRRRVIRIDF